MDGDHGEEETTRAARRRGRGGPSLLGELIKVVLGGAVGLVLAYYGLVYFGGPQYNFLDLTLPGLPAPAAPVADAPSPEPAATKPAQPSTEPDPAEAAETAASDASPSAATPANAAPQGPPPLPPDYVGPRDRKGYLPEDVGRALAAAHAALGCPRCGSTGTITEVVVTDVREVAGRKIESKRRQRKTCPDCKGNPSYRLGPEALEAWCRLGEAAALADDLGSSQRMQREAAIRDLLVQAVDTADKADALGQWATARLDDPSRADQGILLAGRVLRAETAGPLHALRVALDATAREVSVVSDRRPPLGAGDHVLLLAAIIDSPQENLGGYTGDEPSVLWLGQAVQGP